MKNDDMFKIVMGIHDLMDVKEVEKRRKQFDWMDQRKIDSIYRQRLMEKQVS